MTQREKLIELITKCDKENEVLDCFESRPKKAQAAEIIADHLLHNGVIVPPCKVGDTVYTYGARRVKKWKITFYGINLRGEHKMIVVDDGYKNMLEFWNYDIGKNLFLTREEAEKALKESGTNDCL